MYQWVQQLQEVQGDQVCLGDLQYLDMLSHIWVALNKIIHTCIHACMHVVTTILCIY